MTPDSPTAGVLQAGESEEAFALVGSADFRRRVEARRNSVTHVSQVPSCTSETASQMAGYVLDEDPLGDDLSDDAGDVGPEVALVVVSCPLSGDGPRLARVARSDEIHDSTPRVAVEGLEIVPDRRRIQGLVLHPRHEDGRSVGFPLDVTHNSGPLAKGKLESQIKSPGTAAKAKDVDRFGTCSHI